MLKFLFRWCVPHTTVPAVVLRGVWRRLPAASGARHYKQAAEEYDRAIAYCRDIEDPQEMMLLSPKVSRASEHAQVRLPHRWFVQGLPACRCASTDHSQTIHTGSW
eukprot:COSAG01_NODE_40650_length_461_cov_0.848066_1_plen_105_part_01